jgi:hypothetical protein
MNEEIRMKKILPLILSMILLVSLAACSGNAAITADNTNGQVVATQVVAGLTQGTQADGAASATAQPAAENAAEAMAENSQPDEAEDDYTYDAGDAVQVDLEGSTIESDGAGVSIDGSRVTITEAGTYRFSGTLADGQIVVDTPAKETVKLVLGGVDIRSSNSAAIYVADAKKVVIILAEDTQNNLNDGQTYEYALPEDEEPNATIFSKADLAIGGTGSLKVTGNFNDAINSKDGLIIAGGTIQVSAVDDGLRGKDYLVVEGGNLLVEVQGDGMKSDNDEDASLGYILIEGGSLTIRADGDGINAQTDVIIQAGEFTLTTGGGNGQVVDETTSAKGIKAGTNINIDGGEFTIDSADDAIHSNTNVTITGGTFVLATGDDGIHADETLTIDKGDLQVKQSYEGIESAVITIHGGTINLKSSDDGINVAAGRDGSGAIQGMGGRDQPERGGGGPGMDFFGGSSDSNKLVITGGSIYVDGDGDGIDVNGAIEMTGGSVVINGPTQQMNGALDYDSGFAMTGGFLVAAGSSGMAQTPDQGRPSVLIYLSQMQAAGTLIHVQNSAGADVLTFAPSKDYQSVAFSSAQLVDGEMYTVFVGGSSSGIATSGLYEGGSYSGGTEETTFTMSGAGTTAGAGARNNFGPRRQP